ncbi:hypothetical protein Tco_1484720 [Tanacetum coccineum]
MPLGDHAAQWDNYLGELVREFPLHHPSWRQVPPEQKAGVVAKIGTQFDLRTHMESDRWPKIYAGIQQHLQKLYNGKKDALKERYWVPNEDGTYDVERIRRGHPVHIFATNWDEQIAFWNDPKNLARAAQNKKNGQRARSYADSGYNRDNYRSNTDDKPYDLQKKFNDFMKSQQSTNAFVKETFMNLKTQLETAAKNHQASIQNLETKFDRLADKQSGRPSGSLPSNTQPNPKGHNSKAYQPPQSRNKHVNVVFTRSGKSYNPPVNPNDQQKDSETPINFYSDDKDEESTPQPKTQNPKPVKETQLPKP